MVNIATFDIGTCTTVCTTLTMDEEKASVFTSTEGTGLYPSLVAFDNNGKPVVGTAVNEILSRNPKLVAQHAKRNIGTGIIYNLGSVQISPAEVQGTIGMKIYEDILQNLNWPEDDMKLAFTYPIVWNHESKEEFKKGLRSRGLKVDDRLLFSEPLAAMMCVAKEAKVDIEGKTVLLFDIGGGTTDIVVATCVKEGRELVLRTRALGGLPEAGGVDFDRVVKEKIVEAICQSERDLSPTGLETDRARRYAIAKKAEQDKIRLCNGDIERTNIYLPGVGHPFSYGITHDWFVENTKTIVESIVEEGTKTLEKAYSDAPENLAKLNIAAIHGDDDVDYVIFLGGGARIPMVLDQFKKKHPSLADKILSFDAVNPQYAVATGAAYLAKMMLDTPVTTLVGEQPINSRCREGYGIEVLDPDGNGTYCSVHLWEGDVIPSVLEQTYAVPENHADELEISVYSIPEWKREQGSRCNPLACTELGVIKFPCPSSIPAGEPVIVKVSIMHNEDLHVSVTIRGETKNGVKIKDGKFEQLN